MIFLRENQNGDRLKSCLSPAVQGLSLAYESKWCKGGVHDWREKVKMLKYENEAM